MHCILEICSESKLQLFSQLGQKKVVYEVMSMVINLIRVINLHGSTTSCCIP